MKNEDKKSGQCCTKKNEKNGKIYEKRKKKMYRKNEDFVQDFSETLIYETKYSYFFFPNIWFLVLNNFIYHIWFQYMIFFYFHIWYFAHEIYENKNHTWYMILDFKHNIWYKNMVFFFIFLVSKLSYMKIMHDIWNKISYMKTKKNHILIIFNLNLLFTFFIKKFTLFLRKFTLFTEKFTLFTEKFTP